RFRESPLHPVSGGAADLRRRRRRRRLPRALLESRHRRPDDLGRHRGHLHRVLRDRPAGHAPAADDAVSRPRRHGLDHGSHLAAAASAGQRDHHHAAAQLRSAQFPAPSRLRPVARSARRVSPLAAVPFVRAPARDRLGAQQCAGHGARLHRARRLAGAVHAVRLLHPVRARQSAHGAGGRRADQGGDADLGAVVGRLIRARQLRHRHGPGGTAHPVVLRGLRLFRDPPRLSCPQQPDRRHDRRRAGGGAVRQRPQPAGLLPDTLRHGSADPGDHRDLRRRLGVPDAASAPLGALKREKRVLQFIVNWLAGTPSFAAPYALAALGLIIGERAGVLSLGAEGFMLVGALAGVAADLELGGYPAVSLAVAMLAAAGVSLLFALLVVVLRVNQVIAGLAIVFFFQGLTSLVGTLAGWTNRAIGGLHEVAIWPLSDIPIVGRILFTQNLVVYLTIPIFFAVNNILSRSMLGLRLRSVGENPEAADAVGVSVPAYRFGAVVAGSALIGLAGGYLSVVDVKIWIPDMTGGRGWIAIALVIFARWQPWRALFGALLFGCIEALIPRIAAAGIQLPQYFLLMTPYLATIAVMVWAAVTKFGRSNEPAALGQPHVREERR